MICTSKLVMLGFGLSDGHKTEDVQLTKVQQKYAVR